MTTYHKDERLLDALVLLLGHQSCHVIDQFLGWKACRSQPFHRDKLISACARIACHSSMTEEHTTYLQLLRQAEVHLFIILAKLFHQSLHHFTPKWAHILSKQMLQQTQLGNNIHRQSHRRLGTRWSLWGRCQRGCPRDRHFHVTSNTCQGNMTRT